MSDDKVTRINVGGHATGIIGLQTILEDIANEFAGRTDDEIKAELLNRLSHKNYISSRTRDVYSHAFLREFKKFVGEPFEDAEATGMEIKVLGPGCPRCEKLEQDLMAMMAELNIAAELEHVRDPIEIASYGVMGSPALIINGEVKAVGGSVPPKNKLKEWLLEAAKSST
ncbi:MAG: thioredoxin family protein [Desulfobacterales bacterium]